MSENGHVATEVAEQVVAEAVAPAKPWLHPDALRPRDYLRGKEALKDILGDRQSCYDFLGTDEMYTWLIWALRSRDDPSFTWDQALDTEFSEFTMGDERPPPPTRTAGSSGRSESTQSVSGSKPPRRKPATEPNSAPTSV
jgi:hypothetical protein